MVFTLVLQYKHLQGNKISKPDTFHFTFIWIANESTVCADKSMNLQFFICFMGLVSCGATQYMVLCVRMSVCPMSFRPMSFLPVSGPNLQNYIHLTYASANLLLAMLWFGLFASCPGLESPIHFKRLCYYDWRRLDWHSTQYASRSVCPWVLYSATSATRVVIFLYAFVDIFINLKWKTMVFFVKTTWTHLCLTITFYSWQYIISIYRVRYFGNVRCVPIF